MGFQQGSLETVSKGGSPGVVTRAPGGPLYKRPQSIDTHLRGTGFTRCSAFKSGYTFFVTFPVKGGVRVPYCGSERGL